MRWTAPLLGCLAATALLPTASCSNSPAEPDSVEEVEAAPGIWEYLSSTYDHNGDGQVDASEYQKEGAELRTLDNDRDGVLTEQDFVDSSIHSSFDRSRRAQLTMVEYFQDDEQPYNLTREECRRSAQAYDLDGNQEISKVEFRELAPQRHRNLLAPEWLEEEQDPMPRLPWFGLRNALDSDRNRALSMAEVDRFFMDNASGREVWNAERYIGFPLPAGFESLSGPRLGELAPDFELETTDGAGMVRLSSFRGARPVALIFGSYT